MSLDDNLPTKELINEITDLLQFDKLSNYFRNRLINFNSLAFETIYNERKLSTYSRPIVL